jgi:hypothetical protein
MKHIKKELLRIKSQRIIIHGSIIQSYDDEHSLKLCGVLSTTVVASSSLRRGTRQSRDLFQ